MTKHALVVLTRNPRRLWDSWVLAVKSQSLEVNVIVVDTVSNDGTNFNAMPSSWQLHIISMSEFNHGDTRNLAITKLPADTEVVVFTTQDALLANSHSLQKLVAAFDDHEVACAWGRQLPHIEAGLVASPIAAHARVFNYPANSRTVSLADKGQFGLKTCFMSNSFAAYRLADLLAVGGFPSDIILGEDMAVAAKLLMAGKRVAYVAEACAYHSHNYTTLQEFRRYFDTGVFHARNQWLLKAFGDAGGEGLRFVMSEIAYLIKHAPGWLPVAALRTLAKWVGYKLGLLEAHIPLRFKRWCSMHKGYWDKTIE